MDELNQAPPEQDIPALAPTEADGPLEGLSQGAALYKILVDGVEEEVDIETLKKGYSHGKGADKRMTEAGRLKSDATRLLEMLRKDPNAVRKELDPEWDEKGFLSDRLAAIMQDEMLTPEERQQQQDLRELQEYRENKKKEAEAIKERELQEHVNQQMAKLDIEFAEAFEAAGLPKTNEARKRLATLMLEANENGQDLPAKELAKQVKKEMQQEIVELLKSSDDDAFEELMGSDLLSRTQKIALRKVKTVGTPRSSSTPTPKQDKPAEGKKLRTADDILSDLGL